MAKGKNQRELRYDEGVCLHPFPWGLPAVSTASVRGGVQVPRKERAAPPPTDGEGRPMPGNRRRSHRTQLCPVPRARPRWCGRLPAGSPLARGKAGGTQGCSLSPPLFAHPSTLCRSRGVFSIASGEGVHPQVSLSSTRLLGFSFCPLSPKLFERIIGYE